ncbi:MAG TPA: hypothetical protein VLN49_15735 [Gemmatimonadaceae bacterium]|nr:hypothetical protein [Gemmatimonadaceae bacterium]
MSSSAAPRHAASTPSILNPILDFLFVGGLSLIVFVPLLLSGRTDLVVIGAGAQAWLAATINMPHFMASYRLVYRSRDMILKHKWASIYVPAILAAYIVVALIVAQSSPALVIVLVAVSSAYLAWHYTGQVWGMMASYSYLEGTRFEPPERLLIRTGLRILLAWQVVWFLYTQLANPSKVRPLYLLISAGTAVAFVLGAIGIAKVRARTGRFPPARALVAWLALFVWYAVMARDPKAIFWVQIAHAIQYLAFPIRVEVNRTSSEPRSSPRRVAVHMVLYGAGLLAVSILVAKAVPASAMSVVGNVFGEEPGRAAPILLLMFINVHHYFTDGVIWKISNPEVRRDLFAHVKPAERSKPGVAIPAGTNDPGRRGPTPKKRAGAKR